MEALQTAAPSIISGIALLLIGGLVWGIRKLVDIGHRVHDILDIETNHNGGESMKDYMSDIKNALRENQTTLDENQKLIEAAQVEIRAAQVTIAATAVEVKRLQNPDGT